MARPQAASSAGTQAQRFQGKTRATTRCGSSPVRAERVTISTAPGLFSSPPIEHPSRRTEPAVTGDIPAARIRGTSTGPSTAAAPVWLTITVLTR